jgi:hypothetical protein
MLSFIETIISREENCIKRGEHMYMKHLFMNEFSDILNKNQMGGEKLTVTREIRREPVELYIPVPTSDIEPINLDNSEQFLKEMTGGEEIKAEDIQIESDTEDLFEYLKQDLPKEQQGGKPKSILKKKVQININDDRVLSDTDDKPIENKKEKLKRKLEVMWMEQVKTLGKELGIKPPKNKKNLSKTDTIKKILANPKIHDKALKEIRKIELLKSDTASES